MATVTVRDMQAEDEYFVSTCSHVNESAETDACGRRRLAWLTERHGRGLRTKVALADGRHVGFAYVMPIEISPGGPVGRDLMALPCLWVLPKEKGHGAGRGLMDAAEAETRRQGRKALCTTAMVGDFWFMPATFFEHRGYTVVAERGKSRLMWKVFDPSAEPPSMLQGRYAFEPVAGKVAVDLYWNAFCATTDIEAQRVREVAAEFGDAVVLREHSADDRTDLLCHQISRGIYINGSEIGWGDTAPREGIREAINKALHGE
jgi:GNAT superfamily N-acetyltransferase